MSIEGTINIERGQISKCLKCGGMRLIFTIPPSPHAPRWIERNGELMKIDCVGEELF